MSTVFTEEFHAGGYICSEANGLRSRAQVNITGAAKLLAGTILAMLAVSTAAPVYAANAGNTGNFTCSAVVESAGAVLGAYKIEFLDATVFNVFAPNGELVGQGETGAAFSGGGLGFTITAGGIAAVAGDGATITVAANAKAGSYVQLNPAGTDGSQNAAAILFADADATTADVEATAHVRDMEYNASEVIWPAGITGPQQAAAIAQLAALGMIGR